MVKRISLKHILHYGTVLEGQETVADLDDVLPGNMLETLIADGNLNMIKTYITLWHGVRVMEGACWNH